MQETIHLELRQKGKANDERYFELKAGRELHVEYKKRNEKKIFAFSILALDMQGKLIYQYKKYWLILGITAVAVMLIISGLGKYLPVDFEAYILYILSGLFFAALLFFMLLIYTFKCRYVFISIHTKLPLVEFWVNNPSRREYHEFITALEKGIKLYRAKMNIAYDKQLAGELRTLRRVTEAGMLSESVYLAAKAKLLLLSDVRYQSFSEEGKPVVPDSSDKKQPVSNNP